MALKKNKPLDSGTGEQAAKNNTSLNTCSCHNTTFLPSSKLKYSCSDGRLTVSSCPDNSSSTQRQHILSYLSKNGSLTTLQARQELGICHPAARVMELRRQSYAIETIWVNDVDSSGVTHLVARYVLNGGGK